MSKAKLGRSLVFTLVLAVAAACGGSDDTGKIPLGEIGAAGDEGTSGLNSEALAALDSGNVLFRAKAYDQALAQYRTAAGLAQDESVPLFGMLMVANATSNKRLADSVSARLRALEPGGAGGAGGLADTEMADIHGGAKVTVPPPRP